MNNRKSISLDPDKIIRAKVLLLKSRSETYWENGNIEKSLELLADCLNLMNNNGHSFASECCEIHHIRGEVYYLENKLKESLSDFTVAIETYKTRNKDSLNYRGLIYTKMRKFKLAHEDFSQAIDLHNAHISNGVLSKEEKDKMKKNYATILYNRAKVTQTDDYAAIHDLNEAIKNYESESDILECYELKVDICQKYQYLKFSEEYFNDLGYLIEKYTNRSKKANILKIRSQFCLNLQPPEYMKALRDLNTLLTELKNVRFGKQDVLYNRAVCHKNLRNYELGIEDLSILLKKYGTRLSLEKLIHSHRMRGKIYFEMEKYELASEDFDSAISILSSSSKKKSLWLLMHVLRMLRGETKIILNKNHDTAFEDIFHAFEKSGTFSPTNQKSITRGVYELLMTIKSNDSLFSSSEERHGFLEKYANKILEMDEKEKFTTGLSRKEKCVLIKMKGDAQYDRKRYEKAIEEFGKVLDIIPENCRALHMLMKCHFQTGEYQKVIEFGEKLIKFITENRRSVGPIKRKLRTIYERLSVSCSLQNEKNKSFFYGMSAIEQGSGVYFQQGVYRSIPEVYRGSNLVEGGYVVKCQNWNTPSQDVSNFVWAHIAGFFMKNKKEMHRIILKNFIAGTQGPLLQKMMEIDFGSITKKNFDERITLIMESGLLDSSERALKIRWGEQHFIRIPLYFLNKKGVSFSTAEVITIEDRYKTLEERIVLKCLFGISLSKEEIANSIISLSVLFRKLEMYNHLSMLTKDYVSRLSLKHCVCVFSNCIRFLEGGVKPLPPLDTANLLEEMDDDMVDDEDEDENNQASQGRRRRSSVSIVSFDNCLTHALFNRLVREVKTKMFDSNPLLAVYLGRTTYLGNIQTTPFDQIVPILEHKDLKGNTNEEQWTATTNTFLDVYLSILKDIFASKRYTNLHFFTKQCQFGPTATFQVHKEVLIIHSNFFYMMFKFPGTESTSDSVEIENLSDPSLEYILESVYLKDDSKLVNMKLKNLFDLLLHSEMYEELNMKARVLQQIDVKMKRFVETGDFVLKILEVGKHLEELPEELKDLIIKRWEDLKKGNFSVEAVVEHSIFTDKVAREAVEENDKLRKEIKILRDNFEELKRKRAEQDAVGDDSHEERSKKRRRTN